jgi:S1-C subfamily serine protease
LGIRYVVIDQEIQEANNLPIDYGAWIVGSRQEPAIFPGSAAEEVGLEEGDIVLEFNNEKITAENSLGRIIVKYDPGDEITLRVLRDKEEKTIRVILGEYED